VRNKITLLFFLLPLFLFSQEEKYAKVDSLISLIEKTTEDSTRMRLSLILFYEQIEVDADAAMVTAKQRLADAQKIKDTITIISSYDNIAQAYWLQDNMGEALENMQKELEVCLNFKDNARTAKCYNNMGIVYKGKKKYAEALEMYSKSLEISKAANDSAGIASSQGNIGVIYDAQGKYDEALLYLFQCKTIREKLKEESRMPPTLSSISVVYYHRGQYDSAKIFIDAALVFARKKGDVRNLTSAYENKAAIYSKMLKYDSAIIYFDSAAAFARPLGRRGTIINIYRDRADMETSRGNYEEATKWLEKLIALKDSVQTEESADKFAELDARYQNSVRKRENDQLKADAVKSATVTKFLYALAALGLLVALALLYAFRNKQKSNLAIQQKSDLIENQKQEITDSITYARRIQQAILPPLSSLEKQYPDSFVLYLPKAIVSGDFWWMTESADGSVCIAAADCTGHGVPGAFMSMLGVDKLSALDTSKSTANMLSELNRAVKNTLHQIEQNKTDEVNDGMDIALIKTRAGEKQVRYAGANRPLWIIASSGECREYKATKAAIGGHTPEEQIFEELVIPVQSGDCIYLFSDGFADQFGGDHGKKIMTKRMRDWLMEIRHLPMREQKDQLSKRFAEWTGKNEQVDDVLVIGLRMS
jgi:serine phosphatase RsbU (regulator of sigma subunit)/tetratricopeptide (TPR) repeat protein